MTDAKMPPDSDLPTDLSNPEATPQPEAGAVDPVAPEPQTMKPPFVEDIPVAPARVEPERPRAAAIADRADDRSPAPQHAVQPPSAAKKSGSTFLGIVIGAIIAGGVGYGVQHFAPQQPAYDDAALAARLTAAETEAQALRADLARLSETASAPPIPDPDLTARIAGLEAALQAVDLPDLAPLATRIDGLEANLAGLANLPSETGVAPAALAALQAEVAALKLQDNPAASDLNALVADVEARLTEAEASATALAEQATAIAAAATRNAALGQIAAAFDSGLPYRAALTALGDTAIPEVIAAQADTGLPTVASLRDAFPEAARLALEQALRANPGESWTDRVGTFLRNQTGARSLAPREGTDPDAVLSRAEAAVAGSDLPGALTEIAALPPEAQAALANWTALAQQRLDAQATLTPLLQDAEQ